MAGRALAFTGTLHLAYALRTLNRPKEACDALFPVADKFPDEWRIAFQLACHECRLAGRKKARAKQEHAADFVHLQINWPLRVHCASAGPHGCVCTDRYGPGRAGVCSR